MRNCVPAIGCVVVACWASAGHAQTPGEFPFERFAPAIDGESVADVEAGSLIPPLVADVALWGNYALNPLVDAGGAPLVTERMAVHVVAAVGLLEWLELGLELPLVFRQLGDDVAVDKVTGSSLAGAGISDVRLAPKIGLLKRADVGFDLAVLPAVTLPSGFPGGGFLSEGGPTFAPAAALSTTFGPLRVAADLGMRLRNERQALDVVLGHEVLYAAGAALRLHELAQVPVELDLSLHGAVAAGRPFADARENPLEGLLGASVEAPAGLHWFAGAGGGAFGQGTPERRVVLGLRFAPRPAPAPVAVPPIVDDDSDDDAVDDESDRCPFLPETLNGVRDGDGCPEDPRSLPIRERATTPETAPAIEPALAGDRDRDGLADDVDLCPAALEDPDGFEDGDGCPERDNDGDGAADDSDRCPLAAETRNDFDDDDGCPDVPPAALHGLVGVVAGIAFENESADLTPDAVVVLQGVRDALVQYRALTLHIEGHASRDGDPAKNLALSGRRARAVREWLVGKGIADARLEDAGLGDARPIDLEDTALAHARNRRVVLTYKTRVMPK
ncbi:MAG: OmpA family protein [Deltaproteobacteria bacterium]|nr:OmpA family protein [Deltaproteobacteria bacterium]